MIGSPARLLGPLLASILIVAIWPQLAAADATPPSDQASPRGEGSPDTVPESRAFSLPSWVPAWIPGPRATGAANPAPPADPAQAGSARAPDVSAAPAQRQSLVALVEPLWIDLTPEQRAALAPFAPEWNTWPAAEKKSWCALADSLPSMTPERRTTAQQRIIEWANLSPAQRQLARQNYRLAKERPAGQRIVEWRSYQSLTKEQQTVLREAGSTSNTAAGHAGAANGLAKEASQPLPRVAPPPEALRLVPTRSPAP